MAWKEVCNIHLSPESPDTEYLVGVTSVFQWQWKSEHWLTPVSLDCLSTVVLKAYDCFDVELLTASSPQRLSADICHKGSLGGERCKCISLRDFFFLPNEVLSYFFPSAIFASELPAIILLLLATAVAYTLNRQSSNQWHLNPRLFKPRSCGSWRDALVRIFVADHQWYQPFSMRIRRFHLHTPWVCFRYRLQFICYSV